VLRLTLRTLLAYLDDTLEPAQAKDMGQKVAESEFAQETVERIKTVTRRRRLTAPPVEAADQTTDPNVLAEYLDNVLPLGEVTELEQACLDNDTKLAEVAACHQILTLVLGEPAKVPPTARRRRYRLVKGPEAIPYRQPAAAGTPVAGVAAPAAVDEFHDPADDDLLESFLGTRGLLWLVCLFLVVAVLVVAVYLAVPPNPPPPGAGYIPLPTARPDTSPRTEPVRTMPAKKPDAADAKEPPPAPAPDVPKKETEGPPMPRVVEGPPAAKAPEVKAPQPKAPEAERRPVAIDDTPVQPLLFLRRDTQRWEKLDPTTPRVNSTDVLLALPGIHPDVRLESGVRATFWGNVPELLPVGVAETRVTLYVPPPGFDGDLTLHSGRVFLNANKAPRAATIRVRFLDEVWDVTLNTPDTEVAIDVIGEPARAPLFDRQVPEAPRILAYLGVIEGSASVQAEFQKSGDLNRGDKWKWDSKAGRPGPAPKPDPDDTLKDRWTTAVPTGAAAKELSAAVTEMVRRIGAGESRPFDAEFNATAKDGREPMTRRLLAVWMLAGVDGLAELIDLLEADTPAVRDAAAKALQHWCAEGPEREALFAAALANKAAYTDDQRAYVLALTRGPEQPPAEETVTRLFTLLKDSKLAVRELARMQLARIDPAGFKESGYDATGQQWPVRANAWANAFKKRAKKDGF
jgi:hypothetical protein